jgi:hypothetical protein
MRGKTASLAEGCSVGSGKSYRELRGVGGGDSRRVTQFSKLLRPCQFSTTQAVRHVGRNPPRHVLGEQLGGGLPPIKLRVIFERGV